MLAELIAWLREHEPRAEIVFVDDGSVDDLALGSSPTTATRG